MCEASNDDVHEPMLWFCLRTRPTTGRIARCPDLRNLMQTVYSKFGRLLDQMFYG